MSDRSTPLTTIKGGINRQRVKGAALADSLYDLLNGFVTKSRTVTGRPGTFRQAVLPEGDTLTETGPTAGLCAFEGTMHVFSTTIVTVPDGFTLHVLGHPNGTMADDSPVPIKRIHFASPFLGFLYVVAEFEEMDVANTLGNIFHFWLRTSANPDWQANTIYHSGDIIVKDSVAYVATRVGAPFQSWTPNTPREVGDKIEPTVYNDFYYEVTEATGENPQTGDTEPTFPTDEGATVIEYSEETPPPPPETTEPPVVETPGTFIDTRYGRLLAGG